MEANLQKYIAFVKTVELGSFSKAAQTLNYSQSGVSRMIADLEKDWGINLLERNKSGIKLTSDGTKMLPYTRSLCEEYAKLQMEVDELNGVESGLIRIGTFSSAASLWLPNIIAEFQKKYPNVDYELMLGDYTEIQEWVLNGSVDCGFLPLPVDPSLEAIFLERDELMVVMPPNHPLAGLDTFPVKELTNEPFMLLEKGAKAEVAEILEKNGVSPRIRFTTWDDYAIMAMVEKGLGISILTEMILRRCPYNIVTKSLDKPAYREIALVFRGQETSSAALRRFIEYLDFR
jgi:DNA-binding transcriptional LysR family regulator